MPNVLKHAGVMWCPTGRWNICSPLSSSSLVSPKRVEQQEQSKTFTGNHVGKVLWVYFPVLPNSALPLLRPQPPSGSGPSGVLGWCRQSAVSAAAVSSSSETCAGFQIILMLLPTQPLHVKTFSFSKVLCQSIITGRFREEKKNPGEMLTRPLKWRWGHSHNSSDVAIAIRFLPPVSLNLLLCIRPHRVHIAEAAVAVWPWERGKGGSLNQVTLLQGCNLPALFVTRGTMNNIGIYLEKSLSIFQ